VWTNFSKISNVGGKGLQQHVFTSIKHYVDGQGKSQDLAVGFPSGTLIAKIKFI